MRNEVTGVPLTVTFNSGSAPRLPSTHKSLVAHLTWPFLEAVVSRRLATGADRRGALRIISSTSSPSSSSNTSASTSVIVPRASARDLDLAGRSRSLAGSYLSCSGVLDFFLIVSLAICQFLSDCCYESSYLVHRIECQSEVTYPTYPECMIHRIIHNIVISIKVTLPPLYYLPFKVS